MRSQLLGENTRLDSFPHAELPHVTVQANHFTHCVIMHAALPFIAQEILHVGKQPLDVCSRARDSQELDEVRGQVGETETIALPPLDGIEKIGEL